ncbi:hypothetical protein DNTS_015224 [Danionella cerebrum]|uniref:Non-specific serine/threonine protein kinase n=1 Tax=Danionella cerebrum TaxID=2873325 RepID=A0A553QKT9_9TELE|nr:hypothetical protein DNTS_015224 [Danionella translucida]
MNGSERPLLPTISIPSQRRGSQDTSSMQIPKVSQASSTILDKVRAFEQRSQSSILPKVSSSRLPWGLTRTSSSDSDVKSTAGKEKTQEKSDVALKRSFFKQKASSLEEQSTYIQKTFQNKLSEELHRIKKLVGKSGLKKAHSMEQLTHADKKTTGSPESATIQVNQKTESTGGNTKHSPETECLQEKESSTPPEMTLSEESNCLKNKSWNQKSSSIPKQTLGRQVLNEKAALSKVPGQCSPMVPRKLISSKIPFESRAPESLVQAPRKPPRLLGTIPSLTESDVPTDSSSLPKVPIPTIVVENMSVDREDEAERDQREEKTTHKFKEAPAESSLVISRPMQDVKVRAGEMALLECFITGPPAVDVDWLFNGKLIQPALFQCKMQFDGQRCCLLFKSAHEDDSGAYTCKLSTAKDEIICTANLLVMPSKKPLFTQKLELLEAMEGRSAQFVCRISGCPPPDVTWTHCEKPLVETESIRTLKVNGCHTLLIAHVKKENEGLYTVTAHNDNGQAQSSAELCMLEPRLAISTQMSRLERMPSIPEEPEISEAEAELRSIPDFIKPLCDLEAAEGKEAVLKCRVTGMPYPSITWYHNGKKIESTEDRKITQYRDAHSLVIRSVCQDYSGVYKCAISSSLGKAVCYAHLYVAVTLPEPPDGPPVIMSVTGRTVSLSWKRPKTLDPSIDPTSVMYVVQQQVLGSTQWTTIASGISGTTYTITSLSKGVCYSFRVLTSTGKALSKPSSPTDLVQLINRGPYVLKAPVILEKPDIVYVVEKQPVTVTITLNHVKATCTWKRRGVLLVSKPGALEMTIPDDDQHALHIAKVKGSDVGQLIFTASNQYGSDICTLQLAIAEPPSFESIMEDLDVRVGETSRFVVVVDGKPDPDILWFKDGVLLAESSHFTFVYDDRECSLVVLNAQPEDAGVYTCTAKNLAGSVFCKAALTVCAAKHVEEEEDQMEDESSILRKMRRLTDYYDLHKEIGRGAFSYIKRATGKNRRSFAAKFISLRVKKRTCALREMALLAELDHEKIIHFHDAFEKRRLVIIITELCHEELLVRITKKTTILESEVQSIIRQLLEGIEYLHQNDIVHLDIKPENILMADQRSDHIRICDFGNALKITPSEEMYCNYGTPEFIAPEIVNQSPISKSTDIWPVGVLTYLCLTGVSPFAGENDRDTLLNIRNYNVAFEENMFKDLCREAKGFIIKVLVANKLRPEATDCLLHPWFKSLAIGKNISTALHKQVLARRKWQCSLIRYKSKMVMSPISEMLDDSSSHVSLAVPRKLRDGSPPPSSSSDSEEDIDDLPFIPMPHSMIFSGSRMSLTEIHEDENNFIRGSNESYQKSNHPLEEITEPKPADRQKNEDHLNITKHTGNVQTGCSVEDELAATKSRRSLMRRGSSADSALLLQIPPDEGSKENREENHKHMKKSVSMELPNRTGSPKAGKLSKEDYALKLDLMRQRLLRGGTVEKAMSGLRGPLLETLGVDDEKQTSSLDRSLRRVRSSTSGDSGTCSTDSSEENAEKFGFRKRSSVREGNSESISLHRRSGAPLEIPSVFIEDKSLIKTTSTGTDGNNAGLLPIFPRGNSPNLDISIIKDKNVSKQETNDDTQDTFTEKDNEASAEGAEEQESLKNTTESNLDVLPHDNPSNYSSKLQLNGKTLPTPILKVSHPEARPSTGVFITDSTAYKPTLRADIKDIDSEEIFQARFKKRESSFAHGLKRLTRTKSEEKSPVLPRKSNEEVYRPGPVGAPLECGPRGSKEKSKSVQDLREVEKESGLGLIGRFSLRGRRMPPILKKEKSESSDSVASKRQIAWAMGRSKSLDTKAIESESTDTNTDNLSKDNKKVAESPVFAVRRKFESNISGVFEKVRSKSKDRKESETKHHCDKEPEKEEKQDLKKISDSPVLALRKKFESKVSGLSARKQSQSEGESENKHDGQNTPLLSRHHRSQSDGLFASIEIPENQLPSQPSVTSSRETLKSTTSVESSQTPETDRRSRWDRWGLSRSKRDRTPSKSRATPIEDFPPVFHISLKDHVLLEGNPVTLSCLAAGCPEPNISWLKDRKPLEIHDGMNLMACPDGRQLLMITKISTKDAGIYECVATNNLASTTTSCLLSLACVPKRPGTPEIPQIYNNTALIQWKPSDSKVPCTYTLERKSTGDKWLTEATGVTDCFYNCSELPSGSTIRFRVACVNKAGQGPYSNMSEGVRMNLAVSPLHEAVERKTPSLASPPPENVAVATSASPLAQSSVQSQFPFPSPRQSGDNSNTSLEVPVSHSSPKLSIPPHVLSKPRNAVNIHPSTQTQIVSPRSYTAPPSMGRSVSPIPTYIPVVCSASPNSVSPSVTVVNSINPIVEATCPPTPESLAGHAALSTKMESSLRQGVPQKPYSFLEEIARGRFGVIKDCRENATGKTFVAKIVPYDQHTKQSVIKEYELLKTMRNEKIVSLHEAYITPRYLVLIMEYCAGKEILNALVDRFCYSEDDVVGFIVQILQGLEYLHNSRILHLDIKPDNIMVTNLNVAKIIDFGSAQRYNPLSLQQYGRDLGTVGYMAPEVLKGDFVGPPADIWGIGILSYIMCRPTIKDCLNHSWLHDSYLKKLRRQTLTFTTARLKEFLSDNQGRCVESATQHQVLLRTYQSGHSSPTSDIKRTSE